MQVNGKFTLGKELPIFIY